MMFNWSFVVIYIAFKLRSKVVIITCLKQS
nr:MAG TPA: hypothetical protein [Caudoviricetes sp.]